VRPIARLLVVAAALAAVLIHAPAAWAHATLVRAEPADRAVIAASPASLRLTFNEPVSPLAFRLFGPDGAPVALPAPVSENETVTIAAPLLRQGTHLLSWRVISADGHPVGGAFTFSVGAPSAQPAAPGVSDPLVRAAIWVARVAIYLGLFVGLGGAFFRAWIADPQSRAADGLMRAALAAGLVAVVLSVGLQGLDVLDLPLADLSRAAAWQAGLRTSYGMTAVVAACALIAGMVSLAARSNGTARALALAALMGMGLALAFSGHASTAEPRLLNRPAVFVHAVGVAFWVGALLPLIALTRSARALEAFARFSRVIPAPLVLLIGSGAWLAVVQLGRFDALWTTDYGVVLTGKLVLVFVLLALAGANRFWLTPRLNAPDAGNALRLSIAAELMLALVILALVASWRFTPPPRALAAVGTVSVHVHGDKAMAEVEFAQHRPRGADVRILVLDGAFAPLAAKEVTLTLSNPAAGIEPLKHSAARQGENVWRIEDVRIPLAGQWTLRVEILVNDFEKLMLDDAVALPRMP
jgi:copper transport protein